MKLSLRVASTLFLFSTSSFAGPFEFPLPSVEGFEASVVIVNTDGQFQIEMKGSVNPAQTSAFNECSLVVTLRGTWLCRS